LFVNYYSNVPLPLEKVTEQLSALRAEMEDWAGVAYREGEELYSRVGPGSAAIAKTVFFAITEPLIRNDGVSYVITWRATGAQGLFPRLSADLLVASIGESLTNLHLQGTYDPPLGAFGRLVDRALLGRLADATVKGWVDRLAAALAGTASLATTKG
jgi:hypothetical protein